MDFKTRLRRFYEARCPEKCSDVNKIANKYKHKEKELFRQLTFKYGPEPKLSNADKNAIRERNPNKKNEQPTSVKKQHIYTNIDEWMYSLLDKNDIELIKEIDDLNGKPITKHILDRI
tara:strand:- start:4852 stop:5205 length:354 start_codon:yes stop_codon:yes gene_type:complete